MIMTCIRLFQFILFIDSVLVCTHFTAYALINIKLSDQFNTYFILRIFFYRIFNFLSSKSSPNGYIYLFTAFYPIRILNHFLPRQKLKYCKWSFLSISFLVLYQAQQPTYHFLTLRSILFLFSILSHFTSSLLSLYIIIMHLFHKRVPSHSTQRHAAHAPAKKQTERQTVSFHFYTFFLLFLTFTILYEFHFFSISKRQTVFWNIII